MGDTCIFSASRRVNMAVERRNIGIVFQDYAVWPHMTVAENVGYSLKSAASQGEIADRVDNALAMVNMTEYKTTCPASFPAGSSSGWPSPGPWWATGTSS